jgi:hypothetical protein
MGPSVSVFPTELCFLISHISQFLAPADPLLAVVVSEIRTLGRGIARLPLQNVQVPLEAEENQRRLVLQTLVRGRHLATEAAVPSSFVCS